MYTVTVISTNSLFVISNLSCSMYILSMAQISKAAEDEGHSEIETIQICYHGFFLLQKCLQRSLVLKALHRRH